MNDSVLRGFCQTCGWPIYLWDMNGIYFPRYIEYVDENINTHMNPFEIHKIVPVWFLSPKQMNIIRLDSKFKEWCWTNHYQNSNDINALMEFVEKIPFLVVKVLKDAGEKNSKEENK